MQHIKIDDYVERDLFGHMMKLKVTNVTDTKIYCGPWKFDRITGAEIDKDITHTVSYIKPIII